MAKHALRIILLKYVWSFFIIVHERVKDLKTNKPIGVETPIQILKESEFIFECLKNWLDKIRKAFSS